MAGHHAAVIGELDELIALHPLREQLYERRMLALYRAGRQAEALKAFDQLRGQLRDELGVDPGEPLQQLQRQVLTHDPALDVHPAAATDRSDAGVKPSPPLVIDSEPGSDRHPRRRPRYRQQRWVIGSCAVVVAAAAAATTAVVVSQTPRSSLRTLPPNSVGMIDADGSLHDAVAVGQSPDGIVYGFNSLWVANSEDGTVQRVNPHTREVVQTIPVGASPTAVAVAGNDVWVVNSAAGTVSKIDPVDNTVASTVSVGGLPTAIAAGPSGVWVANSGDDTVQRIDPATGTVGAAFDVGDGPDGLAVDAHSVWVANGRDRTLSRLDPDTGQQQPGSPVVGVGAGPKGLALTPSAVWVASEASLSVTRFDVTTGLMTQVHVGDGPHAIVSAAAKIWVSDEYAGTITEIDPASNNRVLHNYATGSSPRGLAVVDSSHNRWSKKSGTSGMPISVFGSNDHAGYDRVTHYVAQVLRELGYRPVVREGPPPPDVRTLQAIGNPRNRIQVGVADGWAADYPSPSTFFDDLFTCHSIGQDNNNPSNRSLYCNRTVDGRIAEAEAEAAESADPTRARTLWTEIDHRVADDAPIVPTFNGQDTTLVSSRVGNYENTPLDLPPLDQIWVQ